MTYALYVTYNSVIWLDKINFPTPLLLGRNLNPKNLIIFLENPRNS